jgi:hypothetical protein
MAISRHTNNPNFPICVCVMFSIAPQKTSRLLQYHTVVNYNVFMEFFKRQTETTLLTILTQISIMKSASTITGKSPKSVFTYTTVFTGDSFTEIYIYNVKIENLEWIGIVTHSKIHYKGIPTQLSMQITNNKYSDFIIVRGIPIFMDFVENINPRNFPHYIYVYGL